MVKSIRLVTRYDIWGLVVNEALACGLPIISTYQCLASLEMIEEGKNGYLTSVDDIALMAKYINDIKQTSRLFDMGYNAIATAKKYTFSTMANAHISAFGRFKNTK